MAKKRIAIALWNYDAQEDNEISFVAGDRILIQEFCNDDWYEGTLGNQSGFFPANHVKVLPEAASISLAQASSESARPPSNASAEVASTNLQPSAADDRRPQQQLKEPQQAPAASQQQPNANSEQTTASQDTLSPSNPPASSGISQTPVFSDAQDDQDPFANDEIASEEYMASAADDWHMVTTEDGQVYYWNLSTNETSWDPPPGIHLSESIDQLAIDEEEERMYQAQASIASAGDAAHLVNASSGAGVAGSGAMHPSAQTAASASDSPSIGSSLLPGGSSFMTPGTNSYAAPGSARETPKHAVPPMTRIEFVMPELIRREGWLSYRVRKEFGGIDPKKSHSLHNHWAIVCVGFLIFYKDEPSKLRKRSERTPVHPSLVITLESITVSREKDTGSKKKSNVFIIQTRSGAVWALQPPSESEVNEWMTTIMEATREASTAAEYENVVAKLFTASPKHVAGHQPPPPPTSSPAPSGSGLTVSHSGSTDELGRKRTEERRLHKGESKKNKTGFGAGGNSGGASAGSGSANAGDNNDDPENKTKIKTKLNAFFKRQQEKTKDSDKDGNVAPAVPDDAVFGGLLEIQVVRDGRPIPILVEKCIHAIDTRGLKSQGIYRLSGNAATIQRIRSHLNQCNYADLDDEALDLNVISGLLKLYFRELKTPLIPFTFYDKFIASIKHDAYNDRLIDIKNLVQQLPKPHYDVLEFLMRHLCRVASESETNKMEPSNLAIVFGPTIIRVESSGTDDMQAAYANMMNMSFQNALVEAMIVQTEWIFDGSPN